MCVNKVHDWPLCKNSSAAQPVKSLIDSLMSNMRQSLLMYWQRNVTPGMLDISERSCSSRSRIAFFMALRCVRSVIKPTINDSPGILALPIAKRMGKVEPSLRTPVTSRPTPKILACPSWPKFFKKWLCRILYIFGIRTAVSCPRISALCQPNSCSAAWLNERMRPFMSIVMMPSTAVSKMVVSRDWLFCNEWNICL